VDLVEGETDDGQTQGNMEKVVRGPVEEESECGTLEQMRRDAKQDLNQVEDEKSQSYFLRDGDCQSVCKYKKQTNG